MSEKFRFKESDFGSHYNFSLSPGQAAIIAQQVLDEHLKTLPRVYQLNQEMTSHVWVPAGYEIPKHTHTALLFNVEEIKKANE